MISKNGIYQCNGLLCKIVHNHFHIMLTTIFYVLKLIGQSNRFQSAERIKSDHHIEKSYWNFWNYLNKREKPISQFSSEIKST